MATDIIARGIAAGVVSQVSADRQAVSEDREVVEAAKTEVLNVAESIPEDYSTLSADVSELKEDLGDLNSFVHNGFINFYPTEYGTFNSDGKSDVNTDKRIRTDFLKVKTGDVINILNGTLVHACGIWKGSIKDSNCIRNDNAWNTENEEIRIEYDGYMIVVFRKPSDEDIVINDFDGSISINLHSYMEISKLNRYVSKNLCGLDPNILYPVNLKKDDYLTISTKDGINNDNSINVLFFDGNKKYVDAFTLSPNTNKRVIKLAKNVEYKYITLNAKPTVPIQVEIGSCATEYTDYVFCQNYIKSLVDKGYYNLYPLINGTWGNNSLTSNKKNRLRLGDFISVKAGDVLKIKNGSLQHAIALWDSNMNRYRNDNAWNTENEEIRIEYDGYMIVVFRKPSDEDIVINDFDGAIEYYVTCDKETVITGNDEIFINNKKVSIYNPYKNKRTNKYKGQLHCHTTNSDGKWSVDKTMTKYSDAGYDFITITDHNFITEEPDNLHGMVWIGNSLEDTRNIAGYQHCNIIGATSVVNKVSMYQTTNTVSSMVEEYVKKQNAIIQYNHPDDPVVYVSDNDLDNMPSGISFVEIYNSCDIAWKKTVQTKSELPVSGNKVNDLYYVEEDGKKYRNINLDPDSMVNVWQETEREPVEQERGITHLLDAGKKVFGTATDDCHCNSLFNYGWVQVFANRRNKKDIWNNLLNGNFYASCGVELSSVCVEDGQYTIDIENGDNATTVFYGKGLEVLKICKGSVATYDFDGTEKYVRAVVQNGDNKAWTQPVWLLDSKYNYEF